MREEKSLGVNVEELNHIIGEDDAASTGFGEGLSGDYLPVVVRVGVPVPGDLLA